MVFLMVTSLGKSSSSGCATRHVKSRPDSQASTGTSATPSAASSPLDWTVGVDVLVGSDWPSSASHVTSRPSKGGARLETRQERRADWRRKMSAKGGGTGSTRRSAGAKGWS